MKRRHAAEIHAWADGAALEFRLEGGKGWMMWRSDRHYHNSPPFEHPRYFFRVAEREPVMVQFQQRVWIVGTHGEVTIK